MSTEAKWNEETQSGTYSDKIHWGEMKIKTNSMSTDNIQELLKPRYKVIGDYPGSEFRIGAIMIFIKDFMHRTDGTPESTRHSDVFKIGNNIIMAEGPSGINLYPHLFKPLAWWQDRKPGEMPLYLKRKTTGVIEKVDHYGPECMMAHFSEWDYSPVMNYEPSTEIEYTNYINKK